MHRPSVAAQHASALRRLVGGWRMQLDRGRALLRRSDFLLLDELANHLDLDAKA
jgi:ATPase subunit of ABC transporter with duplicated ATPase domains